jgi:hypothetical protein
MCVPGFVESVRKCPLLQKPAGSTEPQIAQTTSAKSEIPEICSTVSGKSPVPFALADLARAFPLPWSHYVLLISRSRSPEAFAFYHDQMKKCSPPN